jgi:FlaA1/EpsC-like NDP-sugar epimerase
VLADIRDAERIRGVFEARQPQVVFHAAALKHLSLLESYPEEALKTNVLGTWNVLSAACAVNVEAFVNVSTDKAANPSSVLGYSKLITERLTAAVTNGEDSRFLSVRFGNVVGSRGSVLHTFRHQIRDGGPVCVTDFDATRFFMTVSEAVHLVLQAAAQGEAGATMILDMGDAVSIRSVAEQLIEASGDEIEIVEVGLRDGEKLHEELVGSGEVLDPTGHPQVFSVKVEALELNLNAVQRHMGSAKNYMMSVIQGSEV